MADRHKAGGARASVRERRSTVKPTPGTDREPKPAMIPGDEEFTFPITNDLSLTLDTRDPSGTLAGVSSKKIRPRKADRLEGR